MPEYVPEDRVSFSLDAEGPLVTLRDTSCTVGAAWTVLNRLVLFAIDGPGDEGFIVQRRPQDHTDLAPEGWDEAVDRFGGVMVDVPAVPGRFRLVCCRHSGTAAHTRRSPLAHLLAR